MRQRFLAMENLNVIVIDWHAGAHKFYPEAVANTRVVGAVVAKFIQTVQDNFQADPHQFHVIGHSLGSHVAGYIGKRTDNLGRITGLDPAGPLFEDTDVDVRLDPSDAIFVDCIHSDGLPIYDLGTPHAWGDIDFYPNGASDQPGCPKPVSDVSCSHHRAISYFLETLQQNQTCQFQAYPCSTFKDYLKGSCTSCGDGPCPVLGYRSIDSHRKGKYYLKTNSQSPFCMKRK
ncbi:hypothetical protein LOTGIDRAFT_216933 [Lottia gigantea]|uniref:Lipase domain-containing protein n=1 Tax=Lottia gigantea TaxID=225164 RepID=V4AG78_LOTGI|nr:hypothetical protein LOTGIDRAFT_216933 [Lottia gigantea]ESO92411.1 hypothetical protein LOTGIDRAFT_216933 [Lottia gigantea]